MRRRGALLGSFVMLLGAAGDGAAKGFGPTSIAAGFGSAWIGMGNGDVLRIDAALDGDERRLGDTPVGFVHGLVASAGAIWVVRDRVTRVDPRRNTVRDVPGTASASFFSISAGAGAVWVADDGSNTILRIDPKRVRLEARIRVPGRLWGVAAGPGDVIVVSVPTRGPVNGPGGVRLLRRLNPRTNRLSPPIAQLGCDVGIAVGPRTVWTLDACTGTLARRDPSTLRVVRQARITVLSQTPVVGFGSLWLASRGGTLRVDPITLRIRAVIPARSVALAVDSKSVWALDIGGRRRQPAVRKIDPRTNAVVGATTISVSQP